MLNLDDYSSDHRDYLALMGRLCDADFAVSLFPAVSVTRAKTVARQLRRYADAKRQALVDRGAGYIKGAERHESECERIYNTLPQYARW